ncbi:hypothetical protein L1987_39336 [Smallanthus sonchifolius]|uniref:Uncharacterized protein n=1 Tax=Smallanthus sonchifolius TaxID=185202 RepID=A0ACB9HLI8_9ASTR|nr:hypothetical protein L1987_39336 [Smallanthus sonchifolius]
MKSFTWPQFKTLEFVSSDENLYVRDNSGDVLIQVDFDEMKWVNSERTLGEYAVFVSDLYKCDAAIKPDTWIHPWTQYKRINYPQSKKMESKKAGRCSTANLWYFPHECLIDNDTDMENGALLN